MSLLKEKLELKIEEAEFKAETALGGYPKALKWLIFGGVIAIIPSYFIARIISEKYWEKAYKQYEIVAKPSFETAAAPILSETTILQTGINSYSAVTEISNPNIDLSLKKLTYKFKFFNSNKELIYTSQDKLFLLPNQKKYILVPRIPTNETISSAELELPEEIFWQKKIQIPKVEILTSEPRSYNQVDPLSFVAEGSFTNNSPYNVSLIRLSFVVFDKQGDIIAVSQRDEFTIKPLERRSYKQIWPNVYAQDVGEVLVTADTDVLDPSNLLLPASSNGPASDLDRPETNNYW